MTHMQLLVLTTVYYTMGGLVYIAISYAIKLSINKWDWICIDPCVPPILLPYPIVLCRVWVDPGVPSQPWADVSSSTGNKMCLKFKYIPQTITILVFVGLLIFYLPFSRTYMCT